MLRTYTDDMMYEQQEKRNTVMVCCAAEQALIGAMDDELFSCGGCGYEASDLDADPDLLDPSFCAAVAHSNGAPWDKDSDAQKRREFWTWWLTSAVEIAVKFA